MYKAFIKYHVFSKHFCYWSFRKWPAYRVWVCVQKIGKKTLFLMNTLYIVQSCRKSKWGQRSRHGTIKWRLNYLKADRNENIDCHWIKVMWLFLPFFGNCICFLLFDNFVLKISFVCQQLDVSFVGLMSYANFST